MLGLKIEVLWKKRNEEKKKWIMNIEKGKNMNWKMKIGREKNERGGVEKMGTPKIFDMKMVQKSYKNTLEKNKKREKWRK